MRKYCKAYYVKDLRQFPSWQEPHQEELTEDAVIYLWDDLTVVKSPVTDQVLWQSATPEWKDFCQETLQFAVPEDLRSVYEQEE